MNEGSHSEQAAGGVFVTSRRSMIAGAQERNTVESEAALEKMCTLYWRPVYIFIRRSSPNEEVAKGLTQGFLSVSFRKNTFVRSIRIAGDSARSC